MAEKEAIRDILVSTSYRATARMVPIVRTTTEKGVLKSYAYSVWQSWVGNEQYSVSYFNRVNAFKALYL